MTSKAKKSKPEPQGLSYAAVESRLTFRIGQFGQYVVRIWKKETELKDKYEFGYVEFAAERVLTHPETNGQNAKRRVAETMAALEGVSAVEVCDDERFGREGVVIYTEWP